MYEKIKEERKSDQLIPRLQPLAGPSGPPLYPKPIGQDMLGYVRETNSPKASVTLNCKGLVLVLAHTTCL